MSDVNPGPGWWQASDGRWYPPELRREYLLERSAGGATVLSPAGEGPEASGPADQDAGGPGGGAVDVQPTVHFGRAPGTENRPAGWAALIGSTVMLAGTVLPWASGPTGDLGWRDANGELGGAWLVAAFAVTAATFAVRLFTGSTRPTWRAGLAAAALAPAAIAAAEAWRIHQAMADVRRLSGGEASLSFGLGLAVVALGCLIVVTSAAAFRSDRIEP